MGVGTRYPAYVSASMTFSYSLSSIKFLYFVALISFIIVFHTCVCYRKS